MSNTVNYNEYIFSHGNTTQNNIFESSMHMYQRSFPLLKKIPPQGKVLDLGCGGAAMLRFYQNNFPSLQYYGTDISQTAIDYATKISPSIQFRTATADKIPYPNNFFDLVTVSEVLEHVPNISSVLTEIHRVLKPNGAIYLTMPLEKSLYTLHGILLKLFHFSYSPRMTTHIQILNKTELCTILNQHGFTIQNHTYAQHLLWQICMLLAETALDISGKGIHSLYTPKERNKNSILKKTFVIVAKIPIAACNIESIILKKIPGLDIQVSATVNKNTPS